MNLIERNLKYIIENHGDIYESYQEYGKKIHNEGGPLVVVVVWKKLNTQYF